MPPNGALPAPAPTSAQLTRGGCVLCPFRAKNSLVVVIEPPQHSTMRPTPTPTPIPFPAREASACAAVPSHFVERSALW
jgi:hypothetical protein